MPYPEIDLSRLTTQPIAERESKVRVEDFARIPEGGIPSVAGFLDALPGILAGNSLREAIEAIRTARRLGKPVIWAMGAHVIKCGLSPWVIALMREGVLSAVAMNGAGAIHDSEIARFGKTSEDVVAGLRDGTFGMAAETASWMAEGMAEAVARKIGAGEALGIKLLGDKAPHRDVSILAAGAELGVPVTLHVAMGTDIVHMHPQADGAAIGEASLRDFRILAERMRALPHGGVLMNVGSAVLLPEVLLKAMAILRNLDSEFTDFTGINLDFIQGYRSNTQIVARVRELGGRGLSLTGHHEILIPLIAAGVLGPA